MAVRCAHHGNLDALIAQSSDTSDPFSFDHGPPFELEAELAKEINHPWEVIDDDPTLFSSRKQQHMDCLCDEEGLTFRRSQGAKAQPSVRIPWARVQQTHCGKFAKFNTGEAEDREYLTFHLSTPDQGWVEIPETRVRNLNGLIALANQYTPQLGYVWVPNSEVRGRKVLARAKNYCKISR